MTRHVLQHDGIEREYLLYRPPPESGDESSPLLVFLHGYGGYASGTEAETTQGLNRYAERAGYAVAYPQGTWFSVAAAENEQLITSWNHISDAFDTGPAGPICLPDAETYPCPPECGDCGACGWASCHDDVGFLKSLIATLVADDGIDAQRVFVAGFSNGAMMAQRLACEASDLIAAAFLAGGRSEPGFECTPQFPVALLQVNGGKDRAVPVDGTASWDGYLFSTPENVATTWLDGAACAAETNTWTSPAIEGAPVACSARCAAGKAPAIECLWPAGDHRWPGTPAPLGSHGSCVSKLQAGTIPQSTRCETADAGADIWGSALMFEFFDAQPPRAQPRR